MQRCVRSFLGIGGVGFLHTLPCQAATAAIDRRAKADSAAGDGDQNPPTEDAEPAMGVRDERETDTAPGLPSKEDTPILSPLAGLRGAFWLKARRWVVSGHGGRTNAADRADQGDFGEARSEAPGAVASASKPSTPSRVMARRRAGLGLFLRPDGQFRQPFPSSLTLPPNARTRRALPKSRNMRSGKSLGDHLRAISPY